MKKVAVLAVCLVVLTTIFVAGCATVPVQSSSLGSQPDWVGKTWWEEKGYIFSVGRSDLKDISIAWQQADSRARSQLLQVSGFKSARVVGAEVVDRYRTQDGAVYVLVRVPRDGIIGE